MAISNEDFLRVREELEKCWRRRRLIRSLESCLHSIILLTLVVVAGSFAYSFPIDGDTNIIVAKKPMIKLVIKDDAVRFCFLLKALEPVGRGHARVAIISEDGPEIAVLGQYANTAFVSLRRVASSTSRPRGGGRDTPLFCISSGDATQKMCNDPGQCTYRDGARRQRPLMPLYGRTEHALIHDEEPSARLM
jgi:hypothetical protein